MEGYAKIASLMSHHNELAIFRRFGTFNLQNLLYLQAELTHLEEDLRELVEKDQADPSRLFYTKHWYSLAHSEDDGEKEQWNKVLKIREKLKEYSRGRFPNEHLAQQTLLSGLEAPNPLDLEFFRTWYKRRNMGNFPLRGPDQKAWSPEHSYDLLAIRNRESSDPFSHWLTDYVIPYFHKRIGYRFRKPVPEDPESAICEYSESNLSKAVSIFGTVLSSMIPIVSIVILYFVQSNLVRLGLSVVFTGIFSSCLAIMTKARRVEIFAATSAFAAVQVVFMTGNNGYIP